MKYLEIVSVSPAVDALSLKNQLVLEAKRCTAADGEAATCILAT